MMRSVGKELPDITYNVPEGENAIPRISEVVFTVEMMSPVWGFIVYRAPSRPAYSTPEGE
jgi:hypothetical protein